MKKFFAMIAVMFIMAANVAFAQTACPEGVGQTVIGPGGPAPACGLPANLSGDWKTSNNRFTNTWRVHSLDPANGTGAMDFNSNRNGCNIRNAPLKVEYDGTTLKVTVINPNGDHSILPCSLYFRAELKRGSANDFEGKAWSDPVGSGGNDFVVVTLK